MIIPPVITNICVWQAFTIGVDKIPSNALQAGANTYSISSQKLGVDFAYVTRSNESSRTAHYRYYDNRNVAIGFSWDEPLSSLQQHRYENGARKRAEILTCDTR